MTIPGLLDRSIATFPREAALRHWTPRAERALSSVRVREEVARLAAGLIELGLAKGDRILLLSENRPEWAICDYATMFAGGVLVPLYPNLPPPQTRFILENSGAAVAIASTRRQLGRLLKAAPGLDTLRRILVIEQDASTPEVESLDAVAARGAQRLHARPDAWRERLEAISETDLATIIYTSGTTGRPKGVMLSHANIVSNVEALCSVLDLGPADVALSFLPLCHVTQRIADYCFFNRGAQIVYVPIEDVPQALTAVRPTTFPGVPRIYEKARDSILARAAKRPAVLRALFRASMSVGREMARARRSGRGPGAWLRLRHALADRVVLSAVREGLGGRIRYLVSGGAPLGPDVMEFFLAAGVPILEGYGLTETAILTINRPGDPRPGSVGLPLPGVRLALGEDAEVLASGPSIALGYHDDREATARAFKDGRFHTGDLGAIDAEGHLSITGRKKDLLVTSGGKKVAPAPIEQAVLSHGLVSQVVLVGDRRKFICALVVPDRRRLLDRCRERGLQANGDAPYEKLIEDPVVRSFYKEIFDEINRGLARFEQVKRFALLPDEFSQERGELTPSLKIRRRAVEEKYRSVISSLYETGKEI